MAKENGPSVEEILESIKKVIARDNRSDARPIGKRHEEEPEPEPHVVDVESTDGDEAAEVLDLADMQLAEKEAEDPTEALAKATAPLIGEGARGAMQENLAALAMLAEPGAKPQIVRSGETSLEGLTRELLRPMLAEWLDKNLPGMVENMVQAEIVRIAGKRR